MDYISAIGNGMQIKQYQDVVDTVAKGAQTRTTQTDSFENLFRSAFNMVRETNSLTNMAQEEAMNFAMGYTDNMPYHTGTTQSNRDTYGLGSVEGKYVLAVYRGSTQERGRRL